VDAQFMVITFYHITVYQNLYLTWKKKD